ncbi:lysozyme [Flavobacterium caeni]|uniref:Lysozyme n=1 Tax=Flavobacterium caeni TaxID=490189 RepID=A0A1G5K2J0_9FLAO|nr:lysozyme [Flavobacterium caeni]SCY94674.1 lysozyme [Flavobacterium caeni]
MKLDLNGYNIIADFEGFRSKPYLCSAGVPTIGYGTTIYPNGRKVTMKDPEISKATAFGYLKFIADLFARDVTSLVKSKINQSQFNALVSFAYNLGSDIDADDIPEGLGDSTLLKKVNRNPSDPAIASEFAKWNKASGKVSSGLVKRRAKEAKIYFS